MRVQYSIEIYFIGHVLHTALYAAPNVVHTFDVPVIKSCCIIIARNVHANVLRPESLSGLR